MGGELDVERSGEKEEDMKKGRDRMRVRREKEVMRER